MSRTLVDPLSQSSVPRKRPAWLRFGVALLVIAIGWLARESLTPAVGPTAVPFIFFFPAVAASAWFGGFRPALVSILLGAVAANWFFIRPLHTLLPQGLDETAALAAFLVASSFIAAAMEAMHIARGRLVRENVERRRAESELADARDLLATTLTCIGDGVISTGADGRIMFLNTEAEHLTGWTRSDALGQPLARVFNIINEESRLPVDSPVDKVLRLGTVVGLANHTLLVAKDGTEHPIDDSAAPIRRSQGELSGVVLVFRNVAARRESERMLRESEERFRNMADAAPALIWVSGPDKRLTWFNKVWLDFVGRSMEQELGDGWADCVHGDDLDRCLHTHDTAFEARRPFSMSYRLRRHDGVYRWVLDNGTPQFDVKGRFTGYIGSCMDITERQQAEDALQEADRRKDEFLAILSHELRNPLAPIRMAAAMLRKIGPTDGDIQDLRDIIDRQTTQLARLLDDLLDVSRIASGKIVLRKDRVKLGLAVSSAVESVRPHMDAQSHELVVKIPPEPIYVDADLGRLAQVFANLLNNAARYTEKGGRIELTVVHDDGHAIVRVRDSGIGITPDQLSRIFEMFAQVDQSLERGQVGLGVGLSLAKTLVELHGGRIEARSEGLAKGSEFAVRLPALAPPPSMPHLPAETKPSIPSHRVRVLVADDNVDSAMVLATALRMGGHEVRTVHDGAAAIEAVAAFDPDVAFLDIGMPKLNGYEVARQLRADVGERIMLVAMTGWGQEDDKRRAQKAGFDHHLTKPADLASVEKLISDAATRERAAP